MSIKTETEPLNSQVKTIAIVYFFNFEQTAVTYYPFVQLSTLLFSERYML